jgi:hypothetical protein
MKVLLKLASSSILGLLAGGVVVTPVIAWMNYKTPDGPIFPAPLVAFFVVFPMILILGLIQVGGLIYESIQNRRIRSGWLVLGLPGGWGTGLLMYFGLIDPYQNKTLIEAFIAFSVLGIFLGLVVTGFQWMLISVEESFNSDPETSFKGAQDGEMED